jgi:hypothetical protein
MKHKTGFGDAVTYHPSAEAIASASAMLGGSIIAVRTASMAIAATAVTTLAKPHCCRGACFNQSPRYRAAFHVQRFDICAFRLP